MGIQPGRTSGWTRGLEDRAWASEGQGFSPGDPFNSREFDAGKFISNFTRTRGGAKHGFAPAELRELHSLAHERDPRMFFEQWLAFGGRLEAAGKVGLAAEVYAILVGRDESRHYMDSGVVAQFIAPGDIRKQAQQRLDAISGRGHSGRRAEFLLNHIVEGVTDYRTLLPLASGALLYQVGRAAAVNRLLSTGGLWSRGWGLTLASSAAGFSLEVGAYTSLGRALAESGSPSSLGQDLARNTLNLGVLKLSAMAPRGRAGAAFLGLLSAQRLEQSLGLSRRVDSATTFTDSLALFLQFQIAGNLSARFLGPDFSDIGARLALRRKNFNPSDFSFLPEPVPIGVAYYSGLARPKPKAVFPPNTLLMAAPRQEVEIRGEVDLNQFYGKGGGSDADTTKLKIEPSSIQIRPAPDAPWQEVSAKILKDAQVQSKTVIDDSGRLTLRLQGIDAPELHYAGRPETPLEEASQRAQDRWENGLFRQHGGLRATVAVIGLLESLVDAKHPDKIQARARAWANSPADLFDAYGRMVSELLVGTDGQSLNLWLLAQGWAVPAFYTSMSHSEIEPLRAAAEQARAQGLGLWPQYAEQLVPFDPQLRLPNKDDPPLEVKADQGPFNFPKIFRRQIHYEVNRRAGLTRERSLHMFLKNRPEFWIPLQDHLSGAGAKAKRGLWEIMDKTGKILFAPEAMIFQERPAYLVDAQGKKIEGWE